MDPALNPKGGQPAAKGTRGKARALPASFAAPPEQADEEAEDGVHTIQRE